MIDIFIEHSLKQRESNRLMLVHKHRFYFLRIKFAIRMQEARVHKQIGIHFILNYRFVATLKAKNCHFDFVEYESLFILYTILF